MSCLHPLMAFYDGEQIKFINRVDMSAEEMRTKYMDYLIELPCGKCIECRKAYAKEKALRCALEAKYSKGNFFITLTYKEQIFEKEEAKKDLKSFIDKLRKENPTMKYFACIEKGEIGDRIHAHINVFNVEIKDGRFVGRNFKSDHIEKLWGKGLTDIKPFEPGTAQYTAGYTCGFEKKTLYISQSSNLGANYVLDHKEEILRRNGTIYIGKVEYKMGRWGYKILEKYGSIDIKPIREAQGEAQKSKIIEKLKYTGQTYDEYLINQIETARKKKFKKKGGDLQ